MANNWLESFAVALGFEVNTASLNTAKKSIADYEKAVTDAEKRIEDARWAGAKTEEEIAKLTRETNLRMAREALQNAKDQEKREKDAADKRKEHNRKLLADFEKLALAATAAATAIGYAVGKIASSFDNLYFQAQRSNTSVQSLKALGYAFSQTGGSAQQAVAAVDSFTAALRNNPGLRQFVKDLGVDGSLQGADKLIATLDALKKEPYEVGVQHAGMLGINEDTFNQYVRQGDALKRYRDEYNATTKSLGVDSEAAAKAAASFQRTMTKLQATVSALSDKLLISLAPALQNIAQRFQDWIAANPDRVEKILQGISDALTWVAKKAEEFGEWILGSGGDLLMKRWENFAERIERVARAVDLIVTGISKVVGLMDRLSGTNTSLGSPGRAIAALEGGGSDSRSWWQRHAPKWLGGQDGPVPGGTARIGAAARNENAKTIIGELRSAGYKDNAIAAIVGSMQTESSFNPSARNNVSGGHTGLWQWDSNRWPKIAKWITDHGGSPFDAAWQTRAWVAEHNARPGDPLYDHPRTARGGAILRGNPSIDEAIYGVRESERFGAGEEGGRAANARGWLPHVTAPAPTATRTPGSFDPNNIDPRNLLTPAPGSASPTTNNTNNRSVQQSINNNVTIQGAGDPRQVGRIMEGSLARVHSLALSNAQSAVV